MSSRTLFAAAILAALPAAAWAQDDTRPPATLTIVVDGTAGPILQGSDPLGLNGKSATITIAANETLSPIRQTQTSATYRIPAGDVTVSANGTNYKTTSASKLTFKLGNSADTLTLAGSVTAQGFTVKITDTTSLAANSWTDAVLAHPGPFTPSPQTLTEPASKIKYAGLFGTTVLGITGTASNSDAADVLIADEK